MKELPYYKHEVVQAAQHKTPDNSILGPIAFSSKSLLSGEKDTATQKERC